MPISAMSPAIRIHSWSFVYFRSDGYAMSSPAADLKVGLYVLPDLTVGLYGTPPTRRGRPSGRPVSASVERHRHDARLRCTAADVDDDFGIDRRQFPRHVRHADRFLQKRRLRAARHDTDRSIAAEHRVAMPRDAPVEHFDAHQPTRRAILFLVAQDIAADEIAFVPADNPSHARLEHGRRLIDVVAPQPHGGLEA